MKVRALALALLVGCPDHDAQMPSHDGLIPPRTGPAPDSSPLGIRDYRLKVRIDPAAHALTATAALELSRPVDSVELFLNGAFEIDEVRVGGVPGTHSWGARERKLPYVDAARLLHVQAAADVASPEVFVRYHGRIDGVVFDVNMVKSDLVELAAYAAYYPRLEAMVWFPYTAEVELPSGYTVVTRGTRQAVEQRDGWQLERWRSDLLGHDIPLFASNDIHTETVTTDGVPMAVYYRHLTQAQARTALEQAAASFRFFSTEYGETRADALRMIFSPRAGWGYARSGMFLVSEERQLKLERGDLTEESKRPADAAPHGNAHEISHFWWSIADPMTPHDWINEAVAEYAAATDSRRRDGNARFAEWARFYLADLEAKAPPVGILQTTSKDSYRYASWYERGALFFICAELELGASAVKELLRSLLAQAHERRVETADVLTALERAGADRDWVDGWLRRSELDLPKACVSKLR